MGGTAALGKKAADRQLVWHEMEALPSCEFRAASVQLAYGHHVL